MKAVVDGRLLFLRALRSWFHLIAHVHWFLVAVSRVVFLSAGGTSLAKKFWTGSGGKVRNARLRKANVFLDEGVFPPLARLWLQEASGSCEKTTGVEPAGN